VVLHLLGAKLAQGEIVDEVDRLGPRVDLPKPRECYRERLGAKQKYASCQVRATPTKNVVALGGCVGKFLDK
jgi:hypothetical protein